MDPAPMKWYRQINSNVMTYIGIQGLIAWIYDAGEINPHEITTVRIEEAVMVLQFKDGIEGRYMRLCVNYNYCGQEMQFAPALSPLKGGVTYCPKCEPLCVCGFLPRWCQCPKEEKKSTFLQHKEKK